jgi:hypothetical protein
MRLRIKQARPTSLNGAVRHDVELLAFNRAEDARESKAVACREESRKIIKAKTE